MLTILLTAIYVLFSSILGSTYFFLAEDNPDFTITLADLKEDPIPAFIALFVFPVAYIAYLLNKLAHNNLKD